MASLVEPILFQLLTLLLWISSAKGNFKVLNYSQKLDHFDPIDSGNGTFNQRLMVNDIHWAGPKSGAPIFLFEKSVPLGSIDLAMADDQVRKYSSMDQALQDFAEIIQSLKFNYSAHTSPVIVVGKGYGGALATWFRLKYTNIAIGALASSSPLLYYSTSHPGHGYCSIVSKDFK
ncbi:Lysosomal Pro-X carboxypeptidase, partial [Bienertia sinuspersici]